MGERDNRGKKDLNLQFPLPNSGTAGGKILTSDEQQDARQPHGGDLVDTYWDIPPIEFPTLPDDESGVSSTGTLPAHTAGEERTQVLGTLHGAEEESKDSGAMPLGNSHALPSFEDAISTAVTGSETSRAQVKPDKPEHRSHRPLIAGIIATIVVLAVSVTGGLAFWKHRQAEQEHEQAITACNDAEKSYDAALQAVAKALHSSQTAQKVTSEQVADASTVDVLKQAVVAAQKLERVQVCSAQSDTQQLRDQAKHAQMKISAAHKAEQTVKAASQQVLSSQTAKAATDAANAKSSLQSAITQAQELFERSRYNVADDSTRVALQEALATANDLLEQSNPELTAVQNAIAALQTASDGVNASMNELQAEQEAAAETRQQQRSQSQRRTTTSTPTPTTDTPKQPVCGEGETLVNGQCVTPQQPVCGEGETLIGGQCVVPDTPKL